MKGHVLALFQLIDSSALKAASTPEMAAPRRPQIDVPTTPMEHFLEPPSEPPEPQVLPPPPETPAVPDCVSTFAALARHVVDLPAQSSARLNAVSKLARSLSALQLVDLNFLQREAGI